MIEELQSANWVSYIEPPPREGPGPQSVLKYLARYLTGGPISESRIVAADEQEVTFLAREGTTPGGESKQIPLTLPTPEFTRRWSLHVLPKGYTKTRRYGGWSNPRRDEYLERCAKQLDLIEAHLSPDAGEFGPFDKPADQAESVCASCPKCGGQMILQTARDKPSWYEIMNSPARPRWYAIPASD